MKPGWALDRRGILTLGLAGAAHALVETIRTRRASAQARPVPSDPRETRIRNLRQLTFGGQNAEAYFDWTGTRLVFQSTRPPFSCDQIFTMRADGSDVRLVSTGKGRTTCAYFFPDGKRLIYASTHLADAACPPPPDRSRGYVWPIYPSYDIFAADADGTNLVRLTRNEGYDAEAAVAPDGRQIVFTSLRDGDLDLYLMDADGGHVRRLTDGLGYDGGPFFSWDGRFIVFRAHRPETAAEADEYRALLAQSLVRGQRLEIFVMRADGSGVVQVTRNRAANFAPPPAPRYQPALTHQPRHALAACVAASLREFRVDQTAGPTRSAPPGRRGASRSTSSSRRTSTTRAGARSRSTASRSTARASSASPGPTCSPRSRCSRATGRRSSSRRVAVPRRHASSTSSSRSGPGRAHRPLRWRRLSHLLDCRSFLGRLPSRHGGATDLALRWLPSGLRGRLVLVVLLATVPSVALVVVQAAQYHYLGSDRVWQIALRHAEVAEMAQRTAIEAARQLLAALAEIDAVHRLESAECRRTLGEVRTAAEAYNVLAVARLDGEVACSSTQRPGRFNVADRQYFRAALERRSFSVGEYLIGRLSERPSLAVAAPLFDRDGAVHAVLFAGIDVRWLPTLAAKSVPPDAVVVLVKADGTGLARHPGAVVSAGQSLVEAELGRAVLRADRGTIATDGADGVRRVFGFARIGQPGSPLHELAIAVGIPRGVLVAEAGRELAWGLGAVGLAAALAAVALVIGTGRWLLRDVDGLVAATTRMAGGDLSVRVVARYRGGEVGVLAQAFDDMANAVQARQRESEHAREALQASHETLRAVVAAVPPAIVAVDERGHVTLWNDGAERLFGWRQQDVLGRRNPVVPGHAQSQVDSILERILAGERIVDLQTRRQTLGGELLDVSVSTAPVHDPAGRVIGAVVVYVDIRERKAAQERLARSEAHFRALIENAQDSITVLDATGRIVYQSPAVERLLGYTVDELGGRHVLELIHPDDRERVRGVLEASATTGKSIVPIECRVHHRDGSWRILEGVGTNLLHEPVVSGLVINARDVTERHRTEDEVRRQREMVARNEKLAALGRLAAGVAHELRNPLTVLTGRIALLRKELVPETPSARHVPSMHEAAERMTSIILGLSSYSKPVKPTRVMLDVRDLLPGVRGLIAHEAKTAGVSVAIETADEVPRIVADPGQITQVLLNLATNAVEAMAGAAGGRLTLRVVADRDVRIEVADTGPGIPGDRLAAIWEPFYTTKPEGTGLGLSIVRGIVEDHGGTIRARSTVGAGTTFTVTLPAAPAA